jgi:hypothetical protein
MKERPIIFNGDMVRATQAGLKTQMRRPMNPQPPEWIERFGYTCFTPAGSISGRGIYNGQSAEKFFKCPYGQPGERLWVRETWLSAGYDNYGQDKLKQYVFYKADSWTKEKMQNWGTIHSKFPPDLIWKPSIHMPRWASRITLEIDEIRVERVQDISEDDAKAEGCDFFTPSIRRIGWKNKWIAGYCYDCRFFDPFTGSSECYFSSNNDAPTFRPSCGCQSGFVLRDDLSPEPSRLRFSLFWDSLLHLGWSANSRVWVVKFHRVEVQS